MKFEVLQENLSTALSQAMRFVSPKAQLPILSNFLLEVEEGILKIKATDMESSILITVGIKANEDGKVTVPAKIFAEYVFSVPAGKIVVEEKEETLFLTSGKSKAKFSTVPYSEFPEIEKAKGESPKLTLEPSLVKKISERVCFSVSQDFSRPSMTGVYFDNKKSTLKIVATDGFRLSLLVEKGKEEDFEINVPAKIIEELAKSSSSQEKPIEVFLGENKSTVIFKLENSEIGSRLIEGQYPPYGKIIPEKGSFSVKIDRQDFLRAVKTAAIFAKDVSNIVRLSFEGNLLKISSKTESLGDSENEIDCQKEGEDLQVSFNFKYLLDVLAKMSEKEITMETVGENKPCVFRENASGEYLHLIMPVKKS